MHSAVPRIHPTVHCPEGGARAPPWKVLHLAPACGYGCGVRRLWYGVVWCGVVWCGVVWCGVVWCGVVWCGVVCRRRCYQMAKGRDVYPRAKVNGLGCVCCVHTVCRYVVLGRRSGETGKTWRAPPWRPSLSQELLLHPLSFRLLVQAQLLQRPRHCAALAQAGLEQCGARLRVSVPDPD